MSRKRQHEFLYQTLYVLSPPGLISLWVWVLMLLVPMLVLMLVLVLVLVPAQQSCPPPAAHPACHCHRNALCRSTTRRSGASWRHRKLRRHLAGR